MCAVRSLQSLHCNALTSIHTYFCPSSSLESIDMCCWLQCIANLIKLCNQHSLLTNLLSPLASKVICLEALHSFVAKHLLWPQISTKIPKYPKHKPKQPKIKIKFSRVRIQPKVKETTKPITNQNTNPNQNIEYCQPKVWCQSILIHLDINAIFSLSSF